MSRSVVDTTWLLADSRPRLAPFRVGYVAIMGDFNGVDGRGTKNDGKLYIKSQSRADQVSGVYVFIKTIDGWRTDKVEVGAVCRSASTWPTPCAPSY